MMPRRALRAATRTPADFAPRRSMPPRPRRLRRRTRRRRGHTPPPQGSSPTTAPPWRPAAPPGLRARASLSRRSSRLPKVSCALATCKSRDLLDLSVTLVTAPMSTSAPDERPRVLIVDDEKFIRDILADFLGMEGYIVRTAEDGAAALAELNNAHYDLVISDLKMPRMGGIELLDAIGTTAPSALTVIMTGFGTVETAIDAMKRGAYDYIMKPFKMEDVVRTVRRGLEKRKLTAENMRLKEVLSLYKVSEAIAASLSLDEVMRTVTDAALHEVSADAVFVLIDD